METHTTTITDGSVRWDTSYLNETNMELTFDKYQELAKSTAIYPDAARGFYPIIGLFGECAETIEKVVGDSQLDMVAPEVTRVMEIFKTIIPLGKEAEGIKKQIRKNGFSTSGDFVVSVTPSFTEEEKKEVVKELGDILWYMAAVASDFGISLNDVAVANYEKLKSRMERNVIHGSGDNR